MECKQDQYLDLKWVDIHFLILKVIYFLLLSLVLLIHHFKSLFIPSFINYLKFVKFKYFIKLESYLQTYLSISYFKNYLQKYLKIIHFQLRKYPEYFKFDFQN